MRSRPASGYGEWLHGEAVAAGMVLAAELSRRVSGLAAADASRLSSACSVALRLPPRPPPIPVARWLELMGRDKKATGGVLRFVLLEALGRAIVRTGVDDADAARGDRALGSRNTRRRREGAVRVRSTS